MKFENLLYLIATFITMDTAITLYILYIQPSVIPNWILTIRHFPTFVGVIFIVWFLIKLARLLDKFNLKKESANEK